MELCFTFPFVESGHDALVADLWEAGTTGIIEQEDGTVLAFFGSDPGAVVQRWHGHAVIVGAEPPSTPAPDWEGVCAGQRFYIAPPWVRTETPKGRTRITLHAGAAFGSGRHESTQLMIAAMEQIIQPGQTVVDAGSGSGILSEVARHLGAERVIGCDIDELAVRNAMDNFKLPVFVGSIDAVTAESADVVLVNISVRVIDALAGEIRRVMKRTGVYLLSGFIESRLPQSFRPRESTQLNEWLCWLGTRDGIAATEGSAPLHHPTHWW